MHLLPSLQTPYFSSYSNYEKNDLVSVDNTFLSVIRKNVRGYIKIFLFLLMIFRLVVIIAKLLYFLGVLRTLHQIHISMSQKYNAQINVQELIRQKFQNRLPQRIQ